MSLLNALFTSRWETKAKQARDDRGFRRLWRCRRLNGLAPKSVDRQGHEMGQPFEPLEPRLALSVTTIGREYLVERNFTLGNVGFQPGQLIVAADQGSDVYLQKVDMTPSELLVADNGSFLDYMAIENVDDRYDEFLVTNGAEHIQETAITADQWWLFPTKTNDDAVSPTDDPYSTENLTTTRLALDRPDVVIGPYTEGGIGSDFFGSVTYLQSDGTLSKWTFSAWDGSGNREQDYVTELGEALYITSGPGFGGGPYSFKNPTIAPVEGMPAGYVFPRKISVVTEQLPENLQDPPEFNGDRKYFGGRRHYLSVEWSQTPVTPPVMEANYWGASHYVVRPYLYLHPYWGLSLWGGERREPQNVRNPFNDGADDPPTVGVAMRTNGLRVTIPQAITGGSPDGSPSLGIIPGTASGSLVIGGVGQEEVFRATFEDRLNTFASEDGRIQQPNPAANDRFTLFFSDYDNSGAISQKRTFGLVEGELNTNTVTDLDWRFTEQALRTHTYLEGAIKDASVLEFGIGSITANQYGDLNSLYGDNALNQNLRALDGINVVISEANLLDGTARDAVRVEDLEYHVYVKPAVPNSLYFTAAADFTRAVTVDLLTEGSSVFVNSPIRVDPRASLGVGGVWYTPDDIDLRATNITVNAPMETVGEDGYIVVGRSNSEESPRLPRITDPQGGTQLTPTFLGTLLTDETTTRVVAPTPVLDGYGVGSLEVLPGREGYGYDPADPPIVTLEAAPVVEATVKVAKVSGGVSELLLNTVAVATSTANLLGLDGLEYVDLAFSAPELRVVDSVNRWTLIQNDLTGEYESVPAPEGYFAAPVIAISPPEIVTSVTRIGYGETARVAQDNTFGNGIRDIRIASSDNYNYSRPPAITLRANDGWDFWDERVPPEYRSMPEFDFNFDLSLEKIMETNGSSTKQTGTKFISGHVNGLNLTTTGFGLNIKSLDDLKNNYYFDVSGGYAPGLRDPNNISFVVQNVPTPDQIQHLSVEITDAVLGTLAWKGASSNDNVVTDLANVALVLNDGEVYEGPTANVDQLEDRGLHYEASPDVQFFGQLQTDVAVEFRVDEDFDGDTGVLGDVVYGDQVVTDAGLTEDGKQFYRASLENVTAYADGSESYPFARGKFRDGDYLSYLNDRGKDTPNGVVTADEVVTAHASVDGHNWFRVVPVRSDGLENFYWPAKGGKGESAIILKEGFVNWNYLESGMRIELPGGQVVQVVQWFENTKTIKVSEPIETEFSFFDNVVADSIAGLAPSEQPRGVRFGAARNILDSYRQQLSFRMVEYGSDEHYWIASENIQSNTRKFNKDVDKTLGLLTEAADLAAIDPMNVKHFRLYMEAWFEPTYLDSEGERTSDVTENISGMVDAPMQAFASMGHDPARGRAVLSKFEEAQNGSFVEYYEITNIEVTYGGSGYTNSPDVYFGMRPESENSAAVPVNGVPPIATAIVTGGAYELTVSEAGFNYYGDVVPGLAAEVLRDVFIPVFDAEDMPAGGRQPKADFIARNTSIRSGQIADPGYGLKIVGQGVEALTGFDTSDHVLEPGAALSTDAAVFQAIVEPDGRILEFQRLRAGTGYRIGPSVSVELPLAPRDAIAYAEINSALGIVSRIELADEGYRYAVAPKVYVLPPTPRGEGRAATAVAVLGPSGEVMRIDITDSGSGYTSPPIVLIQEVDAYNVVENVEVAAAIDANKYEWYVSRNVWTEQERGLIHLRPQNPLDYQGAEAAWAYIEAAATDVLFESDVVVDNLTILMNSRVVDQPFAPYELTTLSEATGEHSGTIQADQLVVTMGNDVPTPLSGGTLVNRVVLQTDVRTLRATAAVSERNPRGAFPYDIQIDAIDDLLIEAVPRSSGEIALNVPGDLTVRAGILTDGDISIHTTNFAQTTPLETEFGAISIISDESISILNSVLVKAAPLDERNSDISLHAKSGDINLVGTVSSPNSIYLRQQNAPELDLQGEQVIDQETGLPVFLKGTVGGATRIRTQELRVEAEGNVDVYTDVDVAYGSSDQGNFTLNELNDVSIPSLQVPSGWIRLTADGVDRGGNAVNPVALTARIVEGKQLFVSTPNGSMDIDVDTSSELVLGIREDLENPNAIAAPMLAAGAVKIINTSGSINVLDGPVAGQNGIVVTAATTARLPAIHSYAGMTPGEFPSELSGPGPLPLDVFGGVDALRVGDLVLIKNQGDSIATALFDESRENGVYEVMRLGGGNSGFQDWLLRRATIADSRPDLLPGSYVQIRSGFHRGELYQVDYSTLPEFSVTRTTNSQLVVGAGVGGLLGVDLNDVVSGEGIVPGARVAGIDYENGVVTLGIGNGYQVTSVDEVAGTVQVASDQSLLFEALRYAIARGERAQISGHWFRVGAEIKDWDEATGSLTVQVFNADEEVWENGIQPGVTASLAPEGAAAVIGFTGAATDRISLNPAARTFLINSVEDEVTYAVQSTLTISGEDVDADLQYGYTRVLEADAVQRSQSTIDVIKTDLEGWPVRVGDEITYLIHYRSGKTIEHINRVATIIDGSETSQDDVPTGVIRIGLGDPTLTPSYQGEGLGYKLPDLTLRSRSRLVPNVPDAVDWESLHVGMQVESAGLSDRSTFLAGDGVRLPDGSAYRYDVDRGFLVFGRLSIGMVVSGENVRPGTTLLGFSAENGTVDLSNRLVDDTKEVVFGDKFTTLVDWSKAGNYLVFSDEVETTDFSVDVGLTVESFDISDEVQVVVAGSGYTRDVSEKVEVYFGAPDVPVNLGGVQMEGYAVPDGQGGIKRIVITRPGVGYDSTPNVYVAESTGERALAQVVLNRGSFYKDIPGEPKDLGRFEFLEAAEITDRGSGYTTNRDVRISVTFSEPDRAIEDGAVQMEGYAVPDGAGGIGRIVVTQHGFGYIYNPTVTVAGSANPAGVVAKAAIPGFVKGGQKILVKFSEPDLPGGVQIRGYAVPDGLGGIEGIVVTEPGSGYVSPPTALIDKPPHEQGMRAMAKISNGLGYSTDPSARVGVQFSPPDLVNGIQTLGYAVPDGLGGIDRVVITQQGRGYDKPPSITIEPPLNPSREVLGLRAAGNVVFRPSYPSEVALRNLLGGDGSAVTMTPNFTNYDGLRPGQPVFGDGVRPGTVVTRVLPALRRVEVTPGGLPVRLTVENDPVSVEDDISLGLTGSDYYSDGFDHVLQMPRTFNQFHVLNIGQRVLFPNGEWAETVVTAIDPVYRQIGIRPVAPAILEGLGLNTSDSADSIPVTRLVFDSLDRVEFGMVDRTGTGTASFSVSPFGYEAFSFVPPSIASGSATLKRNDGIFEIEVVEFSDLEEIKPGRDLTGVGLVNGYRIQSFDGKNIRLYSAVLTSEAATNVYSVDDEFKGIADVYVGMSVAGDGVPLGTKIMAVDYAARTVTLSEHVDAGVAVSFGNPFTDKFVNTDNAATGFSVHRPRPVASSLVAAANVRDEVTYNVSTEGGNSFEAGSLARMILVAQRNEYHSDDGAWGGAGVQPVINFNSGVTNIELDEPLPVITTMGITIEGQRDEVGNKVQVNGRFIARDEKGDTVLSTTVVNGFSVEGEGANGTILRGLQFGGFQNGAAVEINGAKNVLIKDSEIGYTTSQDQSDFIRSGSRFGVLVTGNSKNVAIVDTKIVSAEQAAIRVEDDATGTQIVGVELGFQDEEGRVFWNEVGVEIASDDVDLGLPQVIDWTVTDSSTTPVAYVVGLQAGSKSMQLTAADSIWAKLVPGLAVVGVGLVENTFIESVDRANQQVWLSKSATRTINGGEVLIGYSATGVFEQDVAVLSEFVPMEGVYPGQTIRFITGPDRGLVFESVIQKIEGRTITLEKSFDAGGMYERGIRLVEFGSTDVEKRIEEVQNRIIYSRNGVVIGLFGKVSGLAGEDELVVAQDFTGWQSLKVGMEFAVRTSSLGETQTMVVDGWNESDRTITTTDPLTRSVLNAPARFDAADDFSMTSTTIENSIDNGVVIGGGKNHKLGAGIGPVAVLGKVADVAALSDLSGAEAGLRYIVRETGAAYVFDGTNWVVDDVQEAPEEFEFVSYAIDADLSPLGEFEVTDARVLAWLEGQQAEGKLLDQVTVYGTGVPEGATVHSIFEGLVQLGIDGVPLGGVEEVASARLYFGLGAFAQVKPTDVAVGDSIDGEDIFEFLRVSAVRQPSGSHAGYIALSTPLDQLVGTLPTIGGELYFVDKRPEVANIIPYNSGYGISVIDTNELTQLYSDVLPTWTIAGNYIDISYDSETKIWSRRPNATGPLSPLMFARIFGEGADARTYSNFDRTDWFGNQYALLRPISSSTENDNPFSEEEQSGGDGTGVGDTGGGDTGDGGTGGSDTLDPDSGVRPGVPY